MTHHADAHDRSRYFQHLFNHHLTRSPQLKSDDNTDILFSRQCDGAIKIKCRTVRMQGFSTKNFWT